MIHIQLSQLFPTIPSAYDRMITGLSLDSRQIQAGYLFFAVSGTQTQGQRFIQDAILRGAVAIVQEATTPQFTILQDQIPCLGIPQLSEKLGTFAAQCYGHPSQSLQVIGITGTNGKTSISHFIAYLFQTLTNQPCGLLGTLGYGIYGQLQSGQHTTPDAILLQTLLVQLQAQNVQNVVMEVSSHALAQGRVQGVQFTTAVFTNLTRDHLDYHQTMTAYANAKKQLFFMPLLKTAVINLDDPFGRELLADLPTTVTPVTYSLENSQADFFVLHCQRHAQGYTLELQTPTGIELLQSPLYGQFNISNLLAAIATAVHSGLPLSAAVKQLATVPAVPGRMERFGQFQQPTVIVDYAHTPDALEQTLCALREHSHGQLWCVFGCGGNRDRGKRPLMGAIAQKYADKVIITDDNPRYEVSQDIIDDILQGCPNPAAIMPQREQAIRYALQQARREDIILIAGKGHEDYQQIKEQRLPFSDRQIVADLLKTL